MLLNYVENCDLVQNIDTKTGLGEPMNIDGTAFNEPLKDLKMMDS